MARPSSLSLLTTTRRGRAIVAGSLLMVGAGLVVGPTGAVAAPTLPATHVAITSIVNTAPDVANVTVPATSGAPAALLRAGDTSDLTVTLEDKNNVPVAVSSGQETVITLSSDSLFVGSIQTFTVVVPAKATSGTVHLPGLVTTTADITLTAKVTAGSPAAMALAAGSAGPFNLVNKIVGVPIPDSDKHGPLTVSSAGVNKHCLVDNPALVPGSVQTCVELVAPLGVGSDAVFTRGACRSTADCASSGDLLQLLADLSGLGYDNKHPATVIVNCDKSLCGNGGVPSFILQTSLNGGGPLSAAQGCKKKGVIDTGLEFCVDYVQSTRDNAGDLHLYLLIARDVRNVCC